MISDPSPVKLRHRLNDNCFFWSFDRSESLIRYKRSRYRLPIIFLASRPKVLLTLYMIFGQSSSGLKMEALPLHECRKGGKAPNTVFILHCSLKLRRSFDFRNRIPHRSNKEEHQRGRLKSQYALKNPIVTFRPTPLKQSDAPSLLQASQPTNYQCTTSTTTTSSSSQSPLLLPIKSKPVSLQASQNCQTSPTTPSSSTQTRPSYSNQICGPQSYLFWKANITNGTFNWNRPGTSSAAE